MDLLWRQQLKAGSLTTNENVVQVVLAAFAGNPPSREIHDSLCIVESNCLSLHLKEGVIHHVPLPFSLCHILPLPSGLLVQRTSAERDGLPVLFSLAHPLGDFLPVLIRPLATVPLSSFFTDPQLHIVGSCNFLDGTSLLLLHHEHSQKHSLCEILPAKPSDIPARCTPRRAQSNKVTPKQPLSTSVPSHFPSQQTPRTLVATPTDMVLASGRRNVEFNPLLAHLRKDSPFPHSRVEETSVHRVGSGRSPFFSRLQSPVIQNKIRSKSVSPPMLNCMSPYSQIVNSNSWSTLYEESATGHLNVDPLVPQLLLQQLWEEARGSKCGPASNVFSYIDLMQTSYICYLTPSQLWLLPCERDPSITSFRFGKPSTLLAVQTLHIPALHAILVLEPNGSLYLYSGTLKICSLGDYCMNNGTIDNDSDGVESMEGGEGEVVVGISNVRGTSFNYLLKSGITMTCSLPRMHVGSIDELCLKAITEVLPIETAHQMLVHYYCNLIQLKVGPHPNSYIGTHFKGWLLGNILDENSSGQRPPNMPENNWLLYGGGILTTVPSLRLLSSPPTASTVAHTSSSACTSKILEKHAFSVFYALHLAYEELKLFPAVAICLPQLAVLLHELATSLGCLSGYCDHYSTDYPSLLPHTTLEVPSSEEDIMDEGREGREVDFKVPHSPPNIMYWLHAALAGEKVHQFPSLNACTRTKLIVKLFGLYTTSPGCHFTLTSILSANFTDSTVEEWDQLQKKASSPHERVVLAMETEGMIQDDLTSLPVGVALPMWDAIFHYREHVPPCWNLTACDLVGRTDIVKTLSNSHAGSLTVELPEKDSGMTMDQEVLKLHFPRDLRVNEVKRLLNSSQPVKISLEQKPEISDHEFIEHQEITLLAVCQRTMALSVGRGMFTLGSSKPLPTSPLSIPHLDLTGRAPPRNSTVGLEHIDKPPNMTVWPEFHNGVAAGLRLSRSVVQSLDSTWILSNRPSSSSSVPPSSSSSPQSDDPSSSHSRSSPQHAGLLLALGLTGHLASLMDYELFEYLHNKHEQTTIAVLLGIAAARVGSMQRSVASILSIFIPPLLPFGSADMEISQNIQTAGLVAMGLLYIESGNRHLTEVMLREVAHVPGPELEFSEDREAYSLAAGISLGMITLGRGGEMPGMEDLRLVQRLSLLISGGPRNEMVSGPTPQAPSHLVLETNMVNTHVTSPAATVALGLMYLKTNEGSVARRLDAPNSLYELDCIRYDLFILKAASRGLILWDTVRPTQTWINSQVPEIVQKNAFKADRGKEEGNDPPTMDYQTLSQALVCISAGCCMAIGLRYAGTSDRQAHALLMKNIRFLLSKMENSSTAELAGKSCLEMCLNVVVLSIAMVMSGSGDLDVLRVIRHLHSRVAQPEATYGSHMATHIALGLLFLGGCRYSLSRSNRAIACLYTSLYPLFPSSSTDSRYHLQALRHLYVLAAEPRVLVTRDVETGQARSVEVCVRGEGEGEGEVRRRMRTPCIVPEWNSIAEIEICGSNFWPVTLNLEGEGNKMREVLVKTGTVFVQDKTSSQEDELQDTASLSLPLTLQCYITCNVKGELDTSDERIGSLLRKCPYKPLLSPEHTQDSMWQRFVAAALLECVREEKLPIFPSLLHLEKLSHRVLSSSGLPPPSTTQLWQLKLACTLAEKQNRDEEEEDNKDDDPSSFKLLHSDLASVLLLRVKQRLYRYCRERGKERMEAVLRQYFVTGGCGGGGEGKGEGEEGREREREWLAATIVAYGIPPRCALNMTPETTFQQLLLKMESLQAPPSATARLLPLVKSTLPQTLNLPFP